MSGPFTSAPEGTFTAPVTTWGVVNTAGVSTFVPYPNLGQPGYEEVGYGEGGYGEGGYDTPSIPSSEAPPTVWTLVTTR